jgi:hypothetical protein
MVAFEFVILKGNPWKKKQFETKLLKLHYAENY